MLRVLRAWTTRGVKLAIATSHGLSSGLENAWVDVEGLQSVEEARVDGLDGRRGELILRLVVGVGHGVLRVNVLAKV